MPANIVKRTQPVIAGTDDEDIFITEFKRYIVAGIAQHGFMCDVLPGPVKNLLLFEFENLR
jgi:hypothetical protein